MDLSSYSHIELDHEHADDSVKSAIRHGARAEGWYLNPFDCREEMFWTGSAWTHRRSSNTSDPAPLGFEVAPGQRDVRIRAEIHHHQMQPKYLSLTPVRRPSTNKIVLGCAAIGILLLTTWRSAVVRIIDNGAGVDLPLTFQDLRSDKDFELTGFLFSYLDQGVLLSTIAAVVLFVALLHGKFSETGVPRQVVVLSVVFVVLAAWLLVFVLSLRNEADFGDGGLLLGVWLALISHLMCAASAFALGRSQKTVRT